MKTSEFKRKIEAFGLKVTEHGNVFDIHDEYGTRYASINRLVGECVSFNTGRIYLIKLCLEYAETPIHEREDIKKYIVTLPDPENTISYIRSLRKNDEGKVYISSEIEDIVAINTNYRLTEAEIKRNHEYLWQFAKEVE